MINGFMYCCCFNYACQEPVVEWLSFVKGVHRCFSYTFVYLDQTDGFPMHWWDFLTYFSLSCSNNIDHAQTRKAWLMYKQTCTTRQISKTYQRSLFLAGSTTILSDRHKKRFSLLMKETGIPYIASMTANEVLTCSREYCMLITFKSHVLILHYA